MVGLSSAIAIAEAGLAEHIAIIAEDWPPESTTSVGSGALWRPVVGRPISLSPSLFPRPCCSDVFLGFFFFFFFCFFFFFFALFFQFCEDPMAMTYAVDTLER